MSWDEGRLLALEIDANHGLAPDPDHPRRAALRDPAPLAVWAWSPRAHLLALAPGLALPSSLDGMEQEYSPGRLPDALRCLVASFDDRTVTVEGGPCFVFPDRLAVPAAAPLPIIAATTDGRRTARRLIRPDNWQPDEWDELINGRMGQWAMAVHDREPVSICFTPASNATAAEAGVWTRPDFRGKRLAPAVVAAWSQQEHRTRTVLFYSTTADNHASRSVARALGLTPLGWIWTAREGQRPPTTPAHRP
ncbi:GNAT family N-acetyltransferase [Streptomyces uncialis]|uniref:GNAT family N-acetyltransferase n=1 Tax=Streptomyces uncialis TaxID=1048205 RepID=UPI0033CF9096